MSAGARPVALAGLVLLYGGVVVTGMALPLVPAACIGAAMLLGYNLLMRPARDWAPTVPAFCFSLLVLAAVATLLCGFGGLIRGWMTLPPALGPGLCVLGLALSRTGAAAQKAAEMDDALDETLAALKDISEDLERHSAAQLPQIEDPWLRSELDDLRHALSALPTAPDQRAEALDTLLAPFEPHWRELVAPLAASGMPPEIEAAAHLLLSRSVLPQAFGHPEAETILTRIFHSDPVQAEAAARRALALDLQAAECWRLLPSAEALTEQARLFDDPAALTALAAFIAEQEAEDEARHD